VGWPTPSARPLCFSVRSVWSVVNVRNVFLVNLVSLVVRSPSPAILVVPSHLPGILVGGARPARSFVRFVRFVVGLPSGPGPVHARKCAGPNLFSRCRSQACKDMRRCWDFNEFGSPISTVHYDWCRNRHRRIASPLTHATHGCTMANSRRRATDSGPGGAAIVHMCTDARKTPKNCHFGARLAWLRCGGTRLASRFRIKSSVVTAIWRGGQLAMWQ
jgi:hypothetical protein